MKVHCPSCSQKHDLTEYSYGVEMPCQTCAHPLLFQAPTAALAPDSADPLKFQCPHCEQKYRIGEHQLGKEVQCQHCHGLMRFKVPLSTHPSPQITQPKPKRRSKTPLVALVALVALLLLALLGVGHLASQQLGSQPGSADTEPPKEVTTVEVHTDPSILEAPSKTTPETPTSPNQPKEPTLTTIPVTNQPDSLFTKTVQPFLEKNCVRCHGPKKEKGSLRVDQLVADLDDHYSLSHFQNIIDELTVEAMPPEDEPQPDPAEILAVMEVLSAQLERAKEKHSAGGGRPVRRLTRTEFINTIWDHLGVHVDTEGLPDDLLVGSFETNADTLFLTDMHIQAYLKKSRKIVHRFIASRDQEPGTRVIPVKYSPDLMNSIFSFDASDTPPAGSLSIRQHWWLRNPKQRNQITIGPTEETTAFEVHGTENSPQLIESKIYQPNNRIDWIIKRSPTRSIKVGQGLTRKENLLRLKALGKYKLTSETLLKAQERKFKHPVILGSIQHVQVVNPQPYRFFRSLLKNGDQLPDSAAPGIIRKFAILMKRGRPVDSEYVAKLTHVFQTGRDLGLPFWEALKEPLAISMCSLDAMLHFEDRDPSKNDRSVSGLELANRLSYTLWRSTPDSQLVQLGRSGALLDEQVRTEQVARMMKDEKFNRFLSDFADQWFELPRQDEIAVNPQVYPDFDVNVKPFMKEETIQFFSHLVREDLPLANLIDSDFMVLNDAMARHYGISSIHGPEFRVVPRTNQPETRFRGGILTHAGILMQGGTGDRSSLVERGAFIARKLIDNPPGTPPPDVGELPTGDLNTAQMTGVELVNLHASSPQCAGCHAKIDPLGMGLEQFDAVGLLRKMETRLNPGIDSLTRRQKRNPANFVITVPLDTKGYLHDGQTFEGVQEMKQVLLTQKNDLANGFIKALLSYANGREANITDTAIIERVAHQTAAQNHPTRTIIEQVLSSEVMLTY